MQTSDLNVNKTKSDHATAIFRQFQDAIFSREHISVKTSTKIIFDLLQWQEIATLSLPKKAAIASFISTTFREHFCLGANDIARNRSRAIFLQSMLRHFSPVNLLAGGANWAPEVVFSPFRALSCHLTDVPVLLLNQPNI